MHATQPLQKSLRRLALTTKQGPHNYYKGNRTGSMGRHTMYGGYQIDYLKVRTYKCPDLTDFQLTPFVSKKVQKTEPSEFVTRSTSGEEYLKLWWSWGKKL